MPEVQRKTLRMDCRGIDLVNPVDRMQPGFFPYLQNVRVVQEGRLEARPGYSLYNPVVLSTKSLHSIRRLNDTANVYSAAGYTYVVGNGTQLWAGRETALHSIDTGYSGNPLSLVTFRPDTSPAAWMYVYDANKQVKVRSDGAVYPIGVTPPNVAPVIDYGVPAMSTVNDGQTTLNWAAYGSASSPALVDRTNSTSPDITAILYNSGTTGWCCIEPYFGVTHESFWTGERMRVILDSGGGSEETVLVREIHEAIATTTVSSIRYDSGTSGPCSMTFTASPTGISRNSLIYIGSELIRVLSVTYSPDGLSYSIRCSTASTVSAGNTVYGRVSWYCYTALHHVAAETISLSYVAFTVAAAAPETNPASAARMTTPNLSVAGGRPVSEADDYMHCSLYLEDPTAVVELRLRVDVDANTTTVGASGNAFTRNYWEWVITQPELNGKTNAAGNSWVEILIPLSSGTRYGNDLTRTLADVKAIGFQLVTTAACDFGFDCWYVCGTYGPFVEPNAPTGIQYLTTNYPSAPSPATRYELYPLREAVIVTPAASSITGVTQLDIYRLGGTLTEFTYVGSVVNNTSAPNSFTDEQTDTYIVGNPGLDLTLAEPWPVLDLEWSGTVNVYGTTVVRASGTLFDTDLVAGTVITINGVAYQLYSRPSSTTVLEILNSGGHQTGVPYVVKSPQLAAQPLPFVFGPLEGPYAPLVLGLGDPKNPGKLYFSNTANADAAQSSNTIEITAPGEPLVSGGVWNGLIFVGSRDNLFLVRYSYLQVIETVSGASPLQSNRVPNASGIWARWASCRGPDGFYYLGRDGIYRATEAGSANITDEVLYSLFPHDGQAATGANGLLPVDMTLTSRLRLSAADDCVYFDYVDTDGNSCTLRYEVAKKRWFPHAYADAISTHYLVEGSVDEPDNPELLLLSYALGFVYLAGGDTDNGTDITAVMQSPSSDDGDERLQKLYVDQITDADQAGTITVQIGYNNNATYSAAHDLTSVAARSLLYDDLTTLSTLSLYRNISVRYTWTGGPSGPRLYAFEPSFYIQPYLSTYLVTQFITLGVQGWKHHRRAYAGLISTAATFLTIKAQDGRIYGPYRIPSTAGKFRVLTFMVAHGCKDLAFAYELDGSGTPFALFPGEFTIETKDWTGESYTDLPVFKS